MIDSTISRVHKQQEPPASNGNGNGNGHSPIPPFDTAAPAADPFDPAQYALSQDFAATVGVKKLLVTVPVNRANNQAFVRVHPSEAYRIQTFVLQTKGENGISKETYLVQPPLWNALAGEPAMVPKILFLATTRQGLLHLWDIRLPGPDGKLDSWNESAREAAQHAMTSWVRVVPNGSGYDVYAATGDLTEPEWPDMSMRDILVIAFKGRVIDTLDHPVLRRLRGEA